MQIIRFFFFLQNLYSVVGRFPAPFSRYMFNYILQIAVLYGSFRYLLPSSDSATSAVTAVVIFLYKCPLHYSDRKCV